MAISNFYHQSMDQQKSTTGNYLVQIYTHRGKCVYLEAERAELHDWLAVKDWMKEAKKRYPKGKKMHFRVQIIEEN